MPSHLHEALVELFRTRPELAVELLVGPLGMTLPDHVRASVEPGELTELAPTEYRADTVVVLREADSMAGLRDLAARPAAMSRHAARGVSGSSGGRVGR
ncbi:MAG: hypothetical protein L0H84_24035, partial [Pseudonocardia sp.]|nr:hypothetical protein [Pseudonocardia sp.]